MVDRGKVLGQDLASHLVIRASVGFLVSVSRDPTLWIPGHKTPYGDHAAAFRHRLNRTTYTSTNPLHVTNTSRIHGIFDGAHWPGCPASLFSASFVLENKHVHEDRSGA